MRFDPIPLPIAPPLGVDRDRADPPRTLPPRVQSPQQVFDPFRFPIALDNDRSVAIDRPTRRPARHRGDRIVPKLRLPVRTFLQSSRLRGGQTFGKLIGRQNLRKGLVNPGNPSWRKRTGWKGYDPRRGSPTGPPLPGNVAKLFEQKTSTRTPDCPRGGVQSAPPSISPTTPLFPRPPDQRRGRVSAGGASPPRSRRVEFQKEHQSNDPRAGRTSNRTRGESHSRTRLGGSRGDDGRTTGDVWRTPWGGSRLFVPIQIDAPARCDETDTSPANPTLPKPIGCRLKHDRRTPFPPASRWLSWRSSAVKTPRRIERPTGVPANRRTALASLTSPTGSHRSG